MRSRKPRSVDERDKDQLYSQKTHLIHGRYETDRWDYRHHVVPPMSASVTYRLDSTERGAQGFIEFGEGHVPHHEPIYIYERLDEPTRGMLEENLAFTEEGEVAVCFASGMAAISAALGVLCRNGEAIVAHPVLYGCTYSLLTRWMPRQGVRVEFAPVNDGEALYEALAKPDVRVLYFETPTNPSLEIIDIARARAILSEVNLNRPAEARIRMVVDNTFATPWCQRPLTLGADLVVHSLTKNIGGFGTDMGGAVIGPHSLEASLMQYRKDFGGVLSTRSAWPILVYGLPTLAVRMRQQQQTALKVARFLEKHPAVESVTYPGLDSFPQRALAEQQMRDFEGRYAPGSMIYFTMREGVPVSTVVDTIAREAYCVTLAVSLGQIRTLIEHPWSMTHAAVTAETGSRHVNPRGIRISVGLEKGDDIIRDLQGALEKAHHAALTLTST
jgi:cystathionine beta-lyase/cystathionine gamma-synthase